jgi:hypothetical protein
MKPFTFFFIGIALFGIAISFQDISIAGRIVSALFMVGGSFFVGRMTKK